MVVSKQWWHSTMAPSLPAELTARSSARRTSPVRVLHYMGTNYGMTGVETFIQQLCVAQKRAGLVPSVVMDLDRRQEMRAISLEHGIDVIDLPALGPFEAKLSGKIGTALLRGRRIRALMNLIREADVLHIHAVGISGQDAFIAASLVRATPLLVTHHTTLSWFAKQRNFHSDATFWLEKRLASHVMMPYAAAAAELVAAGVPADRAKAIPYCVDEVMFSGLADMPAPGELTLVMPARMHAGKGHLHLLAAMADLSPRYPGLRAVLIGDGPTRAEVEAEIDQLGLRSVVLSKGRVDHREIPALMRGAHVVVLPSYMEGETFPLCLMEGMALGLPAIGARFSGIPAIIEDGETGLLVEPRDEAGLARAIARFIDEPAFYERARRNALSRFRARFTASAVAAAYNELYVATLQAKDARNVK